MATLGDIVINLRANSQNFVGGVNRARGSLGGLNKSSGMTGGHLGQLGAQVGLLDGRFAGLATRGNIAAAALVAVGIAAAKSLGEYRGYTDQLQKSFAIQNLTIDQQLRMSDTARATAHDVIASNEEMAESYFFLASAGFDAEQQIAALPAVANFAEAGNFGMALATDLLTDSQSALGLVVDDTAQNLENLKRVSDVLLGGNTLFNASSQQIAESVVGGVGAQARTLGMELEELVAILGVYADQGKKGAEGSTLLEIALRDLETKAIQNGQAFKTAGIQVHDSEGEFRLMEEIVGDLEASLAGLSDQARKTKLLELGFSDKSVKSLLLLLGTSDQIREYREALEDVAGTTDRVAGNMKTRLGDASNETSKAWSDLKFEVGNLLEAFASPALELFAGGLNLTADAAGFLLRPLADAVRWLERMVGIGFDKFLDNLKLLRDSLADLLNLDTEEFRRNVAALAGVEFVPPEQLAVSEMDFSGVQQQLNAIAGTREGITDLASWFAAGQQSASDVITAIQSVHGELDELTLRNLLQDFANGQLSAEQLREQITGFSDTEAAFEFTVDLTAAEKIGNTFDQQENAVQEAVRRQQELNNAFQAGSITAEEYERASRAVAEARDKATGGSAATAAALQQELDLLGLNVIERERMAAMFQKGARVDDANRVAGLRRELAIGQELLDQQKALAEQKFGAETVDLAERIGLDLDQIGDLAAGDLKSLGLPEGQVQQLQQVLEMQRQLEQNNQQQQQQQQQRDRAEQLTEQLATPADSMREAIAELRQLAGLDLIDAGTFERGILAAGDQFLGGLQIKGTPFEDELLELQRQFQFGEIDAGQFEGGLLDLQQKLELQGDKPEKQTEDRRDRSAAELRTGEAFSRVFAAMRRTTDPQTKAVEKGNEKLGQLVTKTDDLLRTVEENAGELIA